MEKSNRVLFLDFMRGFAVIAMVMGHSIDSVLSREIRATDAFRLYDAFRGFTAPMFLFVSGYAFMIATAKRWDQFRTFGRYTMKRFGKVVLLFVIGYALHFPFFSLDKLLHNTTPEEYAMLFQVDVLHCVATALLILQVTVLVTPNRRVFAYVISAIGACIVFAAPVIWSIDFAPVVSPVLSPYFNQTQLSLFPIFPFAAYLFSGVVAGHYFLMAKETGNEKVFVRNLAGIGVLAVMAGLAFDRLPVTIYPPHDFWKTSPDWFIIRIGIVMLVSIGFYFIRRLPHAVERNLIVLGQASLFIYPVHLIVVYGSAVNTGLMQQIGQTLEAHHAVSIGLLVLLSMLALTYLWNYIRKHHFVPARLIQAGLASVLIYNFVTRPW